MPLPKPRADENQQEFVSRCMADGAMKAEYKEQDQRLAVCYTQWKKR